MKEQQSGFFNHPVAVYISNGGRDKSTGKRLLLDKFLIKFGSRNLQTQALFFCNILNLHSPISVALGHGTCRTNFLFFYFINILGFPKGRGLSRGFPCVGVEQVI